MTRDIVFYNAITDKYIAEVKGYGARSTCRTGVPGGSLAVTCETGLGGSTSKDYLGKSDNVTWFMLQSDAGGGRRPSTATKSCFKPLSVIPSVHRIGQWVRSSRQRSSSS
jgi:hypothetical protein